MRTMAEEVTLSELINIISRIQLNYTYLAKSWYDIFYNPKPIEKVEINYYDDSGKMQSSTIPNLAYARQYFVEGTGAPSNDSGDPVGTIYQDTAVGKAYIMTNTGWVNFISKVDFNSILRSEAGSPEGYATAANGCLYIDTNANQLYMKRTPTGNTGWERIDSYPTSFAREIFEVKQGTEKVRISMKCESDTLISVYVDGTLLNPNKYKVWNDGRTIEFGYYDIDKNWITEGLMSPETEASIEVIVQYYTDIHYYDGGVTADYIELLQNCTAAATTAQTISAEVIQAAEDLQIKIDDAVATARREAIAATEEAIADEADRITAVVDKLDNEVTAMSTVIKSEYRDISEWYTKISQMQISVAEMQRDVSTMKSDIMNNSHYIYAKSMEDDIMLKSQYVSELERIENKITTEDSALKEEFNNIIARVDKDIDTKEVEIYNNLTALENALTTNVNEINNTITSYEQTNLAEHDEFKSEISDIKNTYFNDESMPIGIKSIYQYNKDVNTDARSQVDTTEGIIVDLRRDCLYYTIDLGVLMDEASSDLTFDGFELRPGSSLDSDVTDRLDPETNEDGTPIESIDSDNFTNVMLQARVMFRNESAYKPIILWNEQNLTWLGGEEPDLEPGKDYLIEFISYDIGGTWYAHVMGICQPTVRVDNIEAIFNLTLQNYTNTSSGGTFDVYFDTDEEARLYLTTVPITGNVLNFSQSLPRKWKGTTVKNLRIHETGVDAPYTKHKVAQSFTLTDETNINATINMIDSSAIVVDKYNFYLKLTSNIIENYIKQNEVVPVTSVTESQIQAYMVPDTTTGVVRLIDLMKVETLTDTETGEPIITNTLAQINDIYEVQQETTGGDDPVTILMIRYTFVGTDTPIDELLTDFLAHPNYFLELNSPYMLSKYTYTDPATGKTTELNNVCICDDLTIKLSFNISPTETYEYNGTEPSLAGCFYLYSPEDSYKSGINITLNTQDDSLVMASGNETNGTTTAFVSTAKVTYPGSAPDGYVTNEYSNAQISLDGAAAIDLTMEV